MAVIETVGLNSTDDWQDFDDTRSRENIPNSNSGSEATSGISKFSSGNWEYGFFRPTGVSNISSSATVDDAIFYLWLVTDFGSVTHTATFREILEPWVEDELTHNIYSTDNSWQSGAQQKIFPENRIVPA